MQLRTVICDKIVPLDYLVSIPGVAKSKLPGTSLDQPPLPVARVSTPLSSPEPTAVASPSRTKVAGAAPVKSNGKTMPSKSKTSQVKSLLPEADEGAQFIDDPDLKLEEVRHDKLTSTSVDIHWKRPASDDFVLQIRMTLKDKPNQVC